MIVYFLAVKHKHTLNECLCYIVLLSLLMCDNYMGFVYCIHMQNDTVAIIYKATDNLIMACVLNSVFNYKQVINSSIVTNTDYRI